MANTIQRSFAGGEIAPALYARADLARYAIGLRTCRNMVVMRAGGATKRTGTRLVVSLGTSAAFSLSIPTTLDLTGGPSSGGLTATLLDADSNPVTDQAVTWESDDESIVTVASAGPLSAIVTGVGDGTTNVRARADGLGIVSNDCAVTFTDTITLHTYSPDTTDKTLAVTTGGPVSILVVAAGGAASGVAPGGGGGVTRADNVILVAGQTYTITVGEGGVLSVSSGKGGDSKFAAGGQFGDAYKVGGGNAPAAGVSGESGTPTQHVGAGGAGVGQAPSPNGNCGGGAGGASAVGEAGSAPGGGSSLAAGAGGAGLTVTGWRGTLDCGGGGGGGATSADGLPVTAGAGGSPDAGDGAANATGADGNITVKPYLGGGGGGGSSGGQGGHGSVFVWYRRGTGVVATGGDVTTV